MLSSRRAHWSSTIAVKTKTPYQQLLDAPPGVIAEVIDGELYLQAQGADPHQNAALLLAASLVFPFQLEHFAVSLKQADVEKCDHKRIWSGLRDPTITQTTLGRGGPGGWWIRKEAQFSTSDPNWRTLVPDVSGWRKGRVPKAPETYFDVAPDWVCEVLSPSTRLHDRETKARIYAEEGVAYLWLVDPYRRLFEAYENDGGEWVRLLALKESGTISVAPFGGYAIARPEG